MHVSSRSCSFELKESGCFQLLFLQEMKSKTAEGGEGGGGSVDDGVFKVRGGA